MSSLYLTRVAISRSASARALIQLLNPAKGEDRAAVHHRLLWTLFADAPDRGRDFLWREDGDGRFLILSARSPTDEHRLFEMDEAKPFAPVLATGTYLRFIQPPPTAALIAGWPSSSLTSGSLAASC
jgi:CRISPR system Cascade subunit CasE